MAEEEDRTGRLPLTPEWTPAPRTSPTHSLETGRASILQYFGSFARKFKGRVT